MLNDKSIIELRGIAQSLGIKDIFQLGKAHLMQEIEAKQKTFTPAPALEPVKFEYDARLMTRAPALQTNAQELDELLEPYKKRGLKVEYDEEHWYFRIGNRTDQGTLRMPLRVALQCAEALFK